MAGEYGPYSAAEATLRRADEGESLASQFLDPKRPARTWWNLQKGSMMLTYLSRPGYNPWGNLAAGRGIQWTGMVGLRGIAMGEAGFRGRLTRAISPARPVGAAIRAIGGTRPTYSVLGGSARSGGMILGDPVRGWGGRVAETFRRGGLFARQGVLQTYLTQGENKYLTGLGRLLGGGQIESLVEQLPKGDLTTYKKMTSIIRSSNTQALMSLFGKGKTQEYMKMVPREVLARSARSGGEVLGEALVPNVRKVAATKLLGTAGRVFSSAVWLHFAFALGTGLVQGGLGVAGAAAERIERGLGEVANRRMEFGGQLSAGFFTNAAATERQRALQAIHQSGYSGRGLVGQEAALQHQGSTW